MAGGFNQTLKEELTTIFFKLFFKNLKGKKFYQSYFTRLALFWYSKRILLKEKHKTNKQTKTDYRPTSLLNIDTKFSIKCRQNKFSITASRTGSFTMITWDLSQECRDGSTYANQCDTSHNRMKEKNHYFLNKCKTAFYSIQHLFMTKT